MNDFKLQQAAQLAIGTCLGVKKDEGVLIVTDMEDTSIPEALLQTAKTLGAEAQMIHFPMQEYANQEPPRATIQAMLASDAIFTVETLTLSYTHAIDDSRKAGARIIGMPNKMDVTTFVRLTDGLDMDQMVSVCKKLADKMTASTNVHVTSSLGTDFEFNLDDFAGEALDSIVRNPGDRDWFPPGNTGCGGLQNSGEGILVVNGIIGRIETAPLIEPVQLEVEHGFIKDIRGGREATELINYWKQFENHELYQNCRHVSTLGIGTHPTAKLTSRVLECERISGSVHFCVGKSTGQIDPRGKRGTVEAPSHVDTIMIGCSLTLDGDLVIDKGRLVI